MAGLLSYQLGGPQLTGSQFLGDALSGLGSGLLAYGAGGPTRQQAGLIGLQALQQAPQRRNELAMSGLQQQALRQQIGQGAISNKITNMNAINRLNAINELNGDPRRYTEKDLEDNPDLLSQSSASPALMSTGSGVPPTFQQPQSAPPSQSMTPQSTVMPTAPGNPYQPLSAGPSMPSQGQSQGAQPTGGLLQGPSQGMQPTGGLLQGQQPPQAGVLGGGQPSNGQQGYTQADYDRAARRAQLASFAIDPRTGQLVMSTATNDPRYLAMIARQKAMAEKNQTFDANGNIINMPGAVPAGAEVVGANAYATSQNQLPAQMTLQTQRGAIERMNDTNKAGLTPYKETVEVAPGVYQDVNTNQYAATRGAVPGMRQFTPEGDVNSKALGTYKTDLMTAANTAQDQNVQLNQMLDTMQHFKPSRLAPYTSAARGWLNGIGFSTAESDAALSNYQEFTKTSTKLATEQARQMGAREAASVVTMMLNANPNAQMTPQAITDMVNARKAINDYAIAKNQAGDAYYQQHGSLEGFDTAWQQQHPPVAFLAPYLRPDQLTGELGKQALPYLSQQQLIDLRTKLAK